MKYPESTIHAPNTVAVDVLLEASLLGEAEKSATALGITALDLLAEGALILLQRRARQWPPSVTVGQIPRNLQSVQSRLRFSDTDQPEAGMSS